jgi:hypothetical protein
VDAADAAELWGLQGQSGAADSGNHAATGHCAATPEKQMNRPFTFQLLERDVQSENLPEHRELTTPKGRFVDT